MGTGAVGAPTWAAKERVARLARFRAAHSGGNVAIALGVEGGGTKTEAAVVDTELGVLGLGSGGPVNTVFVRRSSAVAAVAKAVRQAVRAARVSAVDVLALALLCPKEPAVDAVRSVVPCAQVVLCDEAQVAFARAGLMQPYGVAVVAGTGCTTFGYGRNGARCTVGGWGALLGDEGSAFDLAVRGLKAAIRASDGRGPATQLVERALEHFQIQGLWGLVRVCYRNPMPRHQIASFAVEVSAAAAEGDGVAQLLLAEVSQSLTADVLYVAGRLFTAEDAFPVVLSGGVFRAGEPVVAPLKSAATAAYSHADVVVGDMPPGEAVARLGLRALGCDAAG